MPDRHAELLAMLRELKLPAMVDQVADLALKAAKAQLTHEAFLYELVQAEVRQREQRRIARLQRRSGLPTEKTFQTLDLDRFPPLVRQQVERLRGGFLAVAVNVIAVGRPGAGKSHLLAAVAADLVAHGQPVLWTSAALLVQRLLAAKRDLRLPQALAHLDRVAFLVLDDIGYVQHDQDEMEVMFAVLADRYERKSVGISTNLVFSDWIQIFKSPLTTMAAIDRVVHHSVILDLMPVASYRARAALDQQRQGSPPAGAAGGVLGNIPAEPAAEEGAR
jgi:DNA replication protein DnaC